MSKSSAAPQEIRNTKELDIALGKAAKTTTKETTMASPKSAKETASKQSSKTKKDSKKSSSKKSTTKKAPATKKEPKVRVGNKGDFNGFGEGTKLATIFNCLKSGKYTRAELPEAVHKEHPGDPLDATKRTCGVQLCHYKNKKYPYTLVEQKNGKLKIS